ERRPLVVGAHRRTGRPHRHVQSRGDPARTHDRRNLDSRHPTPPRAVPGQECNSSETTTLGGRGSYSGARAKAHTWTATCDWLPRGSHRRLAAQPSRLPSTHERLPHVSTVSTTSPALSSRVRRPRGVNRQ